ncbi:MAG: PAS domain-containing sensor histidine kinase [Methylococcaceae bacterium]|nr:PAS domain-containing sensor histidine kinase [Methylococcaceae bacterium]
MKLIKGDRFGIVMIIATLLVIVLIAAQYLNHRHKIKDLAIKVQGRNIVRLLSNLPYKQLVPDDRRSGILDLLNSKRDDSGFAYAAIVNLTGQPIAVTASGEAIIPQVTLSHEKNLWTTEHEINSQNDERILYEFRAPVLDDGNLAGYIRVGYFKPSLELTEIPFIAQLALPIFLLVPFTYLLIRRELKPLKQASFEINEVMQKQGLGEGAGSNENFQDFMLNFERFMGKVDQRFGELNQQNFKVKASGLALTYQRQRTESALQSLPDAILVMDETGKATYANSKLIPLIGGSLESIIGAKPHEWCQNVELNELLAKYQINLQRFQLSDSIEFNPVNNFSATISVSAYPLFTAKEKDSICGTLVVFKDITQEVLANQARDQFINHVAHELKSPLNVIHMYAEALLEPDMDAEQHISTINVINDEVERLNSLIFNLLNISKIEAGSIALDIQRVKLTEFLTDTFDSVVRSGNDKQIQFDLDLPRHLPDIQFDKHLLRVAINNLLTNAVKYNRLGGKVSFKVEENEDNVIFTITDSGIGITEKDQSHVFEKFYRSDDDNVTQRSGHGLGLALAKEIVDLHQGKLSLQSTVGEGSVFTIELKKTTSFLKSRQI